jgi:outer membrane protein OmpA-like peptidoglycan-associated protein
MNLMNDVKTAICAVSMSSILLVSPAMARAVPTAPGDGGDGERSGAVAQGLGVGGGAALGAVVGGPIGMLLGAGLGVWLGGRVADAGQLAPTEAALEEAQAKVNTQDQRLTELHADNEQLSASLRRSESELSQLAWLADRAERANEELRAALAAGLEMQVMFRTGDAELTESSAYQLRQLAAVLADIDGMRVRLDGYADPRGEADFNETLAAERVANVQLAMIDGGLDKAQVMGFAHGEAGYAAEEGDLDAYAMARRVEISLTTAEFSAPAPQEGSGDQAELAGLATPAELTSP